jgi:hypothetical protein
MIRVLSCIGSKVELDDSERVLEHIARGKWQESYKANLCGFYSHYCKFYGIARTSLESVMTRIEQHVFTNLLYRTSALLNNTVHNYHFSPSTF